jgi:hypothetical protein
VKPSSRETKKDCFTTSKLIVPRVDIFYSCGDATGEHETNSFRLERKGCDGGEMERMIGTIR